jgi:polyisoprenoid-binding protein YceI
MKSRLLYCAVAMLCGGSAYAETLNYKFDTAHSQVHASLSHLGFSASTARFAIKEGLIVADAEDLTAGKVSVVIDAAPNLGDATWDEHMAAEKWFNLAAHPEIRFESTEVTASGEGQFAISGNLTLRGVTKPVTMQAKLNKAGPHPFNQKPRLGFSATASFKRSDFGMAEYVPNVGDEVLVRIEVEAGAP